jgi:hypothetical protein
MTCGSNIVTWQGLTCRLNLVRTKYKKKTYTHLEMWSKAGKHGWDNEVNLWLNYLE